MTEKVSTSYADHNKTKELLRLETEKMRELTKKFKVTEGLLGVCKADLA